MKKTVIAQVKWISIESDGRSVLPPTSGKYCPMIRFDNISNNKGDWSAEIICNDIDKDFKSIIELSYLMDRAPFENLKFGNTFKLYEGANLIAKGKVIIDK